jgi:hypothetical protein
MKKNEYRVELIIHTNEDNPNKITEFLGIKPTEVYVKGEQRYTPSSKKPIQGKYNQKNIWIYSTDKLYVAQDEAIYLDASIQGLLRLLGKEKEKFKEILEKYPSSYFGCYAYYYDSHEYFKINKVLLKELSYYNIDIVFDSYNFSKDESA